MPLKGFKGFNRRKSFGNDLSEAAATDAPASAVSSFRVLERPHYPSKSFDGGHSLLRATAEARPASAGRQGDFERRPPADRYADGKSLVHRTLTDAGAAAARRTRPGAPAPTTRPPPHTTAPPPRCHQLPRKLATTIPMVIPWQRRSPRIPIPRRLASFDPPSLAASPELSRCPWIFPYHSIAPTTAISPTSGLRHGNEP